MEMSDLEFLKEITVVPGGSGDENLVRDILKREIAKVTKVETDGFGDVYGRVGQGPKVLAVGHMDEIGFMVRAIDSKGYLKVGQVGFVFPWGITQQVYEIKTNSGKIIEGVYAMDPDQIRGKGMNEYPSSEDIQIFVGASSREEAEAMGIEVGNAVTPKARFAVLGKSSVLSKAWDNRIGCACSVRVMQEVADKNLKVQFIGGGTVQEEVGCRGGRAIAINTAPDIAFSLDTAPAMNEEGSCLGKGPQLFIMDSDTIANKKLLAFAKKIAKENDIPYQLCYLRRGGSDASEFQNITGGAPSLAIGIAVKGIHSPTGIIDYNDYVNTIKLMVKMLEAMDENVVKELRTY